MVEFTFLYPQFLLLLLLVPFFVFVYFFSIAYNKKKALVFANFKAMERFYDIEFFSKNFMALYLNVAILTMIILAIAGTSVSYDADTSSFTHAILIDTSESMGANDFTPNRLTAAKTAAKRLVDLLPTGTEIGVISFSGDAKVLHAIDTTKIQIKSSIEEITYGDVYGTNIYNAILTANKLFGERPLKSIVLLSDGQSNIQDAPQINEYIERNQIIVHTIAVGTKEGGLTGQNVISKLDEDFLQSIAFTSEGEFFLVEDENALQESINTLAKLTTRPIEIELSFYLLLIALLLFTINWILHNLRFKVVP